VLERRKNKEIDLYSDYTKNKLQALAFAAITSVWIGVQSCNLAYNIHHELADQPRYSISPVVTCAYAYEGRFNLLKKQRFCLRLPHRKQTHVTGKPLGLHKRHKDFRTSHEQASKMVYSFNRFESSFFEYWSHENLHNFSCNMLNFMKYF